jgi:flagellar motor switch protein FliG
VAEPAEYLRLSGPEKAAVLMLSLGEEQARHVFERLDLEEIKEIGQIMSSLGTIGSEVVERLMQDFVGQLHKSGAVIGSFEATERLLGSILDREQVGQIMEEIRGPAGRTVWDKLGNVNEAVLASYLKNEYPQTVAVVLSKIRPDHAARVLSNLPDDLAIEVVMRMLRMEVVQKEILSDVERTLRAEFMSNLARTNRRDNHEVMAEIFNYFDRATETRFMGLLEDRNKEAADRVRQLMFTFDDLARLDPAGIQTLIRTVGNDRLAVALKGATERLRELFFSNMSERFARILKEDMESMGPVRLRDVDEAQMFMVNTAKELASTGEIFVADGKEAELVY